MKKEYDVKELMAVLKPEIDKLIKKALEDYTKELEDSGLIPVVRKTT